MKAFVCFCLMIAVSSSGFATSQTPNQSPAQDRKARAALALSQAGQLKTATEVADAFTVASYREGYQRAVDRGEVFVAYVGCAGKHPIEKIPGAVSCSIGELPGCEMGTIIVGYPQSGQIMEFQRLKCDQWGLPVIAAVEAAKPKCEKPKQGSGEKVSLVKVPWDI